MPSEHLTALEVQEIIVRCNELRKRIKHGSTQTLLTRCVSALLMQAQEIKDLKRPKDAADATTTIEIVQN